MAQRRKEKGAKGGEGDWLVKNNFSRRRNGAKK